MKINPLTATHNPLTGVVTWPANTTYWIDGQKVDRQTYERWADTPIWDQVVRDLGICPGKDC